MVVVVERAEEGLTIKYRGNLPGRTGVDIWSCSKSMSGVEPADWGVSGSDWGGSTVVDARGGENIVDLVVVWTAADRNGAG